MTGLSRTALASKEHAASCKAGSPLWVSVRVQSTGMQGLHNSLSMDIKPLLPLGLFLILHTGGCKTFLGVCMLYRHLDIDVK